MKETHSGLLFPAVCAWLILQLLGNFASVGTSVTAYCACARRHYCHYWRYHGHHIVGGGVNDGN